MILLSLAEKLKHESPETLLNDPEKLLGSGVSPEWQPSLEQASSALLMGGPEEVGKSQHLHRPTPWLCVRVTWLALGTEAS